MKIAIFDMDGTLANVDHRRHLVERQPGEKRDFEAFYQAMTSDTPNRDIIAVLRAMDEAGWKIIICTGRPEQYRAETDDFCWKHDIFYDVLMMRPDDQRFEKDSRVKQQMLADIRRAHDNSITDLIAFDDRDQVVKMWRDNGVRCFQVAEGAF